MVEQDQTEAQDIKPEGWANPPTLAELKQDLADALPSHDKQKAKIKRWLDNLNITGSAVIKSVKGHSKVQPKLIRKQAEWRYAALSEPFHSSEDIFELLPTTFEDKEPARQNGLVLNNQVNTKMDKTALIDEYVRAAVDEGTIIAKIGWEFEEEEVDIDIPTVEYRVNPELVQLHKELHTMREENPTGYAAEVPEELRLAHEESMKQQLPLEATITGYTQGKETKTVKNKPVVEIRDYQKVIIDPACKGNIRKADFIIDFDDASLAGLKRAGKYTNLEFINVQTSSALSDPDNPMDENEDPSFEVKDKPRKKLVRYEYSGFWDIHGNGLVLPIVCTWVGDVMIQLIEMPYPDKELPFVLVPLLPVKGSVYGEPDGELLEDNQKIIGAVTRGMIDIMGRSANGQMGTRKDALDAVNKRRFQSGKDYEYNGNSDPRLAFHMHTYPEIPNSAPLMIQHQYADAESMSGVKAFAEGINSGALGNLATGVNGALDAAGKREMGILRRLKSGMIEIGRKIVSMNSEFLEDEEIVRITNEKFVAIRRDDLAGNFDIRMDISTAEEDNVKAKELAFMQQTMGPNSDPGITRLIQRDIARLRKMPELAKEIENYQPQPDPLAEEIRRLEMEKLKAEITKLQSETAENFANAELDAAKTGTEDAKVRQLNSVSDKQDLDFVEQESGTKQEREKELQGTQAEANIELKKVEHALKTEDNNLSELQKYVGGK